MAIAPESIDEVKSQINVYDIISQYLPLEKAGNSYRALCPFHPEKTPSFYVSPQKNIWKCFGCGKSGNAISFVMEYEGISFTDAIIKIAEKYNIKLKFTGKDKYKENTKYHNLLEEVLKFYKQQLKTNLVARKYLSDREILPSTIEKFDIGYSPEDYSFIKWVEDKGINKEDLVKVGVLSSTDSKKDKFSGRIIFPIRNVQGKIVGFGGRSTDQKKSPKYLNSPETEIYKKSEILFGLFENKNNIMENREAILVEGYFDVISPYQIGIKNAVATLGTALSLKQAKLLKKFADRVYILYDSDEAGKKAAIKAAQTLLYVGIEVYYSPLEDKDPDELAKKGYKTFKEHLEKSETFLEFLLKKIKYAKEINTRKKLIQIYLQLLSYMQDKILAAEYLNTLSEVTGIDKSFLEIKPANINENIEDEEEIDLNRLTFSEKIILKGLVENKEFTLKMINKYGKILFCDYFNYLIEYIETAENEYDFSEKLKNIPYDEKSIEGALKNLILLKKEEEMKLNSEFYGEEEIFEKKIKEIQKLKNLDPKFNKTLQEESLGHDDA
jgi:DNA primase